MNCQLCQQDLSAYLDNELSEVAVGLLQKHLATCLGCQTEYESLLRTQALLKEVEVFEPDPAIWTRVEQRIARRKVSFSEIILSAIQNLIRRYAYLIPKPALIATLATILLIMTAFKLHQYYEEQALMAWVEQYSIGSIDLDVNPFGLQTKGSLDENPFASFSEASLDLNINYFSSSLSPEDEALVKNPFSI